MTLTIGSLDFVRNASTILGFSIFLETPERSGKDHDDVVALAAAKKYRAFVDKTFPASDVAQRLVTLSRARALAKILAHIRGNASLVSFGFNEQVSQSGSRQSKGVSYWVFRSIYDPPRLVYRSAHSTEREPRAN